MSFLMILVLSFGVSEVAASCYPTNPGHWYAYARSGTGNGNLGTAVGTTTPAHWSVDRSANNGAGGVWDNAAWLGDNKSIFVLAIECGFFSGKWPYDGTPFTNNIYPYVTFNNGGFGYEYNSGGGIAGNTALGLFIYNTQYCHVGGYVFDFTVPGQPYTYYTVPEPATNYSQGEVIYSTATWMNGGSGTQQTGYWTPGSGWYQWGGYNSCVDSPYFLQTPNPSQWLSGGY